MTVMKPTDVQLNGSKVSMREFFDLRIDSVEHAFNRALAEYSKATEQALVLRTQVIDKHLDALNGEAARLKEMQATYVLQTSYDLQHEILKNEFSTQVNISLSKMEIINADIIDLKLTRAELIGKADKSAVSWTQFVSVVGMIFALLGLVHSYFP